MTNHQTQYRSWAQVGTSVCKVLSVVGPSICIVHCLAMPVILALLPAMGLGFGTHLFGLDDRLLAVIVLPLCLFAIIPGYLKHGRKRVILALGTGLSLVVFGSFAANQLLGNGSEIPVNILGSILLIAASLQNHHFSSCDHNH